MRPNGDLRLIDYDGMWVPALGGEEGNETGHPDYQDPRRTQKDFHAAIDEFSDAVIQIAICALTRDGSLWAKYNNGDNLLFRRRDFLDTQSSPLIADLRKLGDPEINEKLNFVVNACPRPRKAPGKKPVAPRAPAPAAWLSDYVEGYRGAPGSVSSPRSAPSRGAPVTPNGAAAPARNEGIFRALLRAIFGP